MPVSCNLCDRKSLLLYPVRYAVACPHGAAKAPALEGNFKIDSAKAPATVGTAKYTLRAMRAGYLYVYEEKRKRLKAYMVLPSGMMWSFIPGMMPPNPAAVPATCMDRQQLSLGYCIDVEHSDSDPATNIWIGWSNVLWTKRLVGQADDAGWRMLHMQCINVPAMLSGGATDTGEFQASHSKVAHFAMDEKAMKTAFKFSNTDPRMETRQHMARSPMKKGFVVAVNDPVGLTNDLGELVVPSIDSGFNADVYRGSIAKQLLARAEQGIRAQASEEAGFEYRTSEMVNQANQNPMSYSTGGPPVDIIGAWKFVTGSIKAGGISNYNAQQAAQDKKYGADETGHQNAAADEAWDEASHTGEGSARKPSINYTHLNSFPREYNNALDKFKPQWDELVKAHAGWLDCKLLADWMSGVHDDADIRSGYAYSESCSQSIGSAAATDACAKVLNDWLETGQLTNSRNLYARALLFNQKQLIDAAQAQIHKSDIQYENFLNLYKQALARVKPGEAARLLDKLVLTTGSVIVKALTKGARSVAFVPIMIRLSLHSGTVIRASSQSKAELRAWAIDEAKKAGIKLETDRTQTRADALKAAKTAVKAGPKSDVNVVIYELDVDALEKAGKIEAGSIKAVKLPGADKVKAWLGSSAPEAFHLGVATFIFQLFTLQAAVEDVAGNDRFNRVETDTKAAAAVINIVGAMMETVSETVEKGPTHPLSAFILKQWSLGERELAGLKLGGRALGAITGAALAVFDVMNAVESFKKEEFGLTALYAGSSILGFYVAAFAITGAIPGFWIVLAASILIALAIAHYKASAMKDWISRSYFGTGEEKYPTLEEELSAFNSAAGG
jgi:hypothetical protein